MVCLAEPSRTFGLAVSGLEPNRFPKNDPMLLEFCAAEATRTCTVFTAGAMAKTRVSTPCGNASAGGRTCAGMVPEAVAMAVPGPPLALSAERNVRFMSPSPPVDS